MPAGHIFDTDPIQLAMQEAELSNVNPNLRKMIDKSQTTIKQAVKRQDQDYQKKIADLRTELSTSSETGDLERILEKVNKNYEEFKKEFAAYLQCGQK